MYKTSLFLDGYRIAPFRELSFRVVSYPTQRPPDDACAQAAFHSGCVLFPGDKF